MTAIHAYLPSLLQLVRHVSQRILTIYHQVQPLTIQEKSDDTPLTEADLLANTLLVNALQQLAPDIPIISEESQAVPYAVRKNWQRCWLIDPVDGTREFIAKTDDFTINIALIENHCPVFGLIHIPVTNTSYYVNHAGQAVKRLADGSEAIIKVRKLSQKEPLIIASRHYANNSILQNFLQQVGNYAYLSRGSALKFCLVAEGVADAYPRFGDTSEWDTAAGQCILEAAGGAVIDTQGQPLRYNRQQTLLNPHFLAVGSALPFWRDCLQQISNRG